MSELGIAYERCPFCGDFVGIQVTSDPDADPMEGLLLCSSAQCTQGQTYQYAEIGTFSGDTPSWKSAPILGPAVVLPDPPRPLARLRPDEG